MNNKKTLLITLFALALSCMHQVNAHYADAMVEETHTLKPKVSLLNPVSWFRDGLIDAARKEKMSDANSARRERLSAKICWWLVPTNWFASEQMRAQHNAKITQLNHKIERYDKLADCYTKLDRDTAASHATLIALKELEDEAQAAEQNNMPVSPENARDRLALLEELKQITHNFNENAHHANMTDRYKDHPDLFVQKKSWYALPGGPERLLSLSSDSIAHAQQEIIRQQRRQSVCQLFRSFPALFAAVACASVYGTSICVDKVAHLMATTTGYSKQTCKRIAWAFAGWTGLRLFY